MRAPTCDMPGNSPAGSEWSMRPGRSEVRACLSSVTPSAAPACDVTNISLRCYIWGVITIIINMFNRKQSEDCIYLRAERALTN
eukprot:7407062-Pyramimonas_sp.AAC.1